MGKGAWFRGWPGTGVVPTLFAAWCAARVSRYPGTTLPA
jgi:hypothetical protein